MKSNTISNWIVPLSIRTISAIVLITALIIIYLKAGKLLFTGIIILLSIVAAREFICIVFYKIEEKNTRYWTLYFVVISILITMVLYVNNYNKDYIICVDIVSLLTNIIFIANFDKIKNTLMSAFYLLIIYVYILIPFSTLLILRLSVTSINIASFFIIVWITDTMAYFFGKIIKGRKLCPKISPNKTWAGAIGGLISSAAFGVYAYNSSNFYIIRGHNMSLLLTIIVFCVISAVAQCGDIFESYFKRCAKTKDSGHLIPGHGGILDRIDGLMFVYIVLGIVVFLFFKFNF